MASHKRLFEFSLRAPVVLMVLAATAVPVQLRPWGIARWGFGMFPSDFLANVVGYIPLGIVLAGLGPFRAICIAGFISMFAETSQFAIMYRDPSVIDLAANILGAILGVTISVLSGIRSPVVKVDRRLALLAATLACVLVIGVRALAGDPINQRGWTAPGILEAYWTFDENSGSSVLDSSGHGLGGTFSDKLRRVAGKVGQAVQLDGKNDYIDFGHSSAFRLVGSMTVSAWIKPSSFPIDDSVIVSNHNGLGYQLDTTVDQGARTISFKLGNACGQLMARYGATPLVANTWYYVAGVYNAEARTIDVYLNGKLDNGPLVGLPTPTQRSSREHVYVGRRSDTKGYEFAGSIDEVRIYSRAVAKAEIVADMHDAGMDASSTLWATVSSSSGNDAPQPRNLRAACGGSSDREDARMPGAAVMLGVLVAIACIGLWPSGGPFPAIVLSFVAGLLFLLAASPTLPSLALWILPLASFAGGASVAGSSKKLGSG